MSETPDSSPGDGGQSDTSQPGGSHHEPGQTPQQTFQTGPGLGEIFNRPETKNELKIGIALNGLMAVGIAFVALGLSMQSGGGNIGGFFGGSLALIGPLVLAPLVGVVIGLRQADVLDDQPDNLLYANAGATTIAGTFVFMLVSMILGLIIVGSGNLGQAMGQAVLPFIVAAIGAGLVAAGTCWVDRNIVPGPSRPPRQSPGPGQQP